MTAEDDLRINTLHRFTKRSPRLVLRDYSRIDGQVLLRWSDHRLGLPVFVAASGTNARSDVWLDGEHLTTVCATLRSGAHVLAVHLRPLPDATETDPLFWATVRADIGEGGPEILTGRERTCFTTSPPPDTFSAVGFDDEDWEPAMAANEDRIRRAPRWVQDGVERWGRPPAAFEGETWVRIHFDVDVLQFREST